MKLKKKLTTLTLAFTLLLSAAAPLAVYAAECGHSPSYTYTQETTRYTHTSQYGACTAIETRYYKVLQCNLCHAEFSKTLYDLDLFHSQPHG